MFRVTISLFATVLAGAILLAGITSFAQPSDHEREVFARNFITNLVTQDTAKNFEALYPQGVPDIKLTKREIQNLVARPSRNLNEQYILFDLFPENPGVTNDDFLWSYEWFRRTNAIHPEGHGRYLRDSQGMLIQSLILMKFEEKVFSRRDLGVFGFENVQGLDEVLKQAFEALAKEAPQVMKYSSNRGKIAMIQERFQAASESIPNWRRCQGLFTAK